MSASIADQLVPLLESWARVVMAEATNTMLTSAQALAPVGETGETRDSLQAQPLGDWSWEITCEDRGYTDEGPEAHTIQGNPLLAFDWPEQGLFPAVFRRVNWVPGEGVAANKGWFSERAMDEANYDAALLQAADAYGLGVQG